MRRDGTAGLLKTKQKRAIQSLFCGPSILKPVSHRDAAKQVHPHDAALPVTQNPVRAGFGTPSEVANEVEGCQCVCLFLFFCRFSV